MPADPRPATTTSNDQRLDEARSIFSHVVAYQSGAVYERLAPALVAVHREAFAGPPPWYISIYAQGKAQHIAIHDPIHLYQDVLIALDRDKGINNGEPVLHARLLGALAPPVGGTVLHVGCGGGYYTAILAELVGPAGRVMAYEIVDALAAQAAAALAPWANVTVNARSATVDALPKADAIYVNAGATRPHALWLDALNDRGRLVFPLSSAGFGPGVSLLIERRGDAFAVRAVSPSGFINCIGATDQAEGERVSEAVRRGALWRAQSLVRDTAPDDTAVLMGDGWWMSSRPLSH